MATKEEVEKKLMSKQLEEKKGEGETEDQKEKDVKRKREIDEKELERLAVEKLLSETKRNKMRADREGASGWYDFPRPKANKRFARAVIKSAVLGNSISSKNKKTE
ncbi:PREDICTED: uncharacterized protein LOC109584905 [Amphimedon queenslandica]|uniref:Uncharacterized protein n=1 Tax=Amphimedon queenslandica TaxID=400682 RepID=A0A1X7VSB5_AMPQE|nr:PREDICTED: uncharacterized protein LOC109584905 [Amphimedon queenslandica]|eukprot:XP_019856376.1 PREDICTED: uncharacterized protein LOC109584905 [Amphimedon queenslandica]